jgi:hypothetical protein
MSRPISVRTAYFYDEDGCQNSIDIRVSNGYYVEINGEAVYQGDRASCDSWFDKYISLKQELGLRVEA